MSKREEFLRLERDLNGQPELKRKLGIMMPRSVREQVQTFVDFVHHLDISKY